MELSRRASNDAASAVSAPGWPAAPPPAQSENRPAFALTAQTSARIMRRTTEPQAVPPCVQCAFTTTDRTRDSHCVLAEKMFALTETPADSSPHRRLRF